MLKGRFMMTNKLSNYNDVLSKLLVIIGIVLTIILSFYWDFGFQPLEIKSIFTVDVGSTSLSIDPEYFLALLVAFSLYAGYRLYVDRERTQAIEQAPIETKTEIIVMYLFFILLGIVGVWITYNEFSTVYIWFYFFPDYVRVSRGSLALRINAIIALLLLLNWLIIFRFHLGIRYRKSGRSK